MVTVAPTRTVQDLTTLFNHAGHVLSTRLTVALAGIGLTPRMQCVLQNALEGERTQIQLAELAHLDKTTMVMTIDELESAGYARRELSSTDRRARVIVVTEDGARIASAGQKIVDQVHSEALAELEEQDRKTFLCALTQLVEDHLAMPLDCDRPVRRARTARRRV
ncbi:MAG: MarR family winged helix-turn-helix transcriptional regulator [Actinocatenispora sp.]